MLMTLYCVAPEERMLKRNLDRGLNISRKKTIYNRFHVHRNFDGNSDINTLMKSSFSSLDSTSPLHYTLARLHHHGATCSLPNYFTMFPFRLISYTHSTITFPSYPQTPFVTVPTLKLPTLTQ